MNIAVGQSGGPTVAINSSLMGVFRGAANDGRVEKIYGSINGIEGLINDNLVDLKKIVHGDAEVELIRQTPATVLGSCRYKLPDPDKDDAVFEKITATFKKYDIGAFFYIGGNDSMDTVMKLHKYFTAKNIDIKVVGVPKTIDNDLTYTDHTPGFGSAAKYVATTMLEITRDSSVYDLSSVTLVEIMGRDTGWLTASSALIRANGEVAPHLIYLPETKFSVKRFLDDIRQVQKKHKTVIVAISEGVEPEMEEVGGEFQSGAVDTFGHKYLSGIATALSKIVKNEIGCKVRAIELNVMQRCSSHVSSLVDLDEAQLIGKEAVKTALEGKSGVAMVFKRVSDSPYTVDIDSVDVTLVANKVKYFPAEWITADGHDVTDAAIEYALPLIQGEPDLVMKNGLPAQFIINK